jgi:hypothetical protein
MVKCIATSLGLCSDNPTRTGRTRVGSQLGHGRACPGHPDNVALCHPDRDRRDKPGDDAMSFAPLLRLFISLLHMGDKAPSLVIIHYCHETRGLIDDVVF